MHLPMKSVLLCFLLSCLCSIVQAAPDPPFEDLLRRAETVFLARVVSVNSDHTYTVESTEVLRGKCDIPLTYPVDRFDGVKMAFQPGTQFLCLSQGDAKLGPPRPVFGCSFDGKHSWRGWMTLAIERVGQEIFVKNVFTHVDGYSFGDNVPDTEEHGLKLSRIKQFIERFPYGSVRGDH